MNEDNEKRQTKIKKKMREMSEAEIDENLKGSFPASDPPSWTLGTNHRAPTGQRDTRKQSCKKEKKAVLPYFWCNFFR